ncbi:MAG: UTP--glucose-1-phosphate uridylyltransferase [Deltaproteobacteria bacterium]|nr:UTP--glucose-1-phosphate uridylyltransferase [Deltaproteobacteria bacterium]
MLNRKSPLAAFVEKMTAADIAPSVIATFSHYYQQIADGETGLVPEKDLAPVATEEVPALADLSRYRDAGKKALKNAAAIILNGGLGTSMGLTGAKSLLEIKNGLSFLEIKLRQAEMSGVRPVFMNSFNTHADTLATLARLRPATAPYYFIQNKFPKIRQADLRPATWPQNPDMEWNPPGHGDIYSALHGSGLLQKLLDEGIEYALISNSDNLGATLDPVLLGYVADNHYPFMMEVARRTPADRKGGHIARHKKGNLILREIAQCPPDEVEAFQDIRRYSYFNTNNIWVNLVHLNALIQEHGAVYLPIILNPKTLDPRAADSPPVFQIETAMGAAISLFQNAAVVQTTDTRFFPVKTCNELLVIQSDRYQLTSDYRIVDNRNSPPGRIHIHLDQKYFGKIDMYHDRFGKGIPSLVACESLEVEGDVFFEADVQLQGRVVIRNRTGAPATIKKGTVIEGELLL